MSGRDASQPSIFAGALLVGHRAGFPLRAGSSSHALLCGPGGNSPNWHPFPVKPGEGPVCGARECASTLRVCSQDRGEGWMLYLCVCESCYKLQNSVFPLFIQTSQGTIGCWTRRGEEEFAPPFF